MLLGVRILATPFLICALLHGQAAKEIDEFKKRASVERAEQDGTAKVKVSVDGTCLYSGPGKNARVEVESSARLQGRLFVSVKVEGEEVGRFWVRSLSKPVKFPPTLVLDPDSMNYSSSSQGANGKTTCAVTITDGTGAQATVYEGPGTDVEPRVVGKAPKRWYSIRVDEEIVYFAPASNGAAVEKALSDLTAKKLAEGSGVQKEAAEETFKESASKILGRLNEFRVSAGLQPVKEDRILSDACQLHAFYLEKNPELEGLLTHTEDSKNPGYTELGKESAARSVNATSSHYKPAAHYVDGLIATLYHRIALLNPRLSVVGIGIAPFPPKGRVVVIDCHTMDWQAKVALCPVVYPKDEAKSVPLSFSLGHGEFPEPRPDPKRTAGYPITITCYPPDWSPGEATAKLSTGDQLVESWVFCRENEALSDHPLPETICILPRKPLKPNTTYKVEVTCKQYGVSNTPPWSKTWTFTTGSGEGEPKE